MSEHVQEGATFQSIEEVRKLMESLGFIAYGLILQPENPLETLTDSAIAEDAERQIQELERRYGEENIALVPSPEHKEWQVSVYSPLEHKLVFIRSGRYIYEE